MVDVDTKKRTKTEYNILVRITRVMSVKQHPEVAAIVVVIVVENTQQRDDMCT